MRVLKLSSAAVIVLLLFFASLPPSETSQPGCGIPKIGNGFSFDIEGWNCGVPTDVWFNDACSNAYESSCTREEAVDEIMKEASEEITATKEGKKAPPETLTELKKAFRKLVEKSLKFRDIRDGNPIKKMGHMLGAFARWPYTYTCKACRNLGKDFDFWRYEIIIKPADVCKFCSNYRRILPG